MHHYKGFLKCGVVYGVTSLIDRCIINLRAFVDLWGYECFWEGRWLGRPHHVDWPPEHSIDVRVQNVSFQARVFSIPSKVQGHKMLFSKAILQLWWKNYSLLSLVPVLSFRTLIWTQDFPVNCINGINDLIPAENIKYLRNCFSQMTHYYYP